MFRSAPDGQIWIYKSVYEQFAELLLHEKNIAKSQTYCRELESLLCTVRHLIKRTQPW